jgi:hypothetical protein
VSPVEGFFAYKVAPFVDFLSTAMPPGPQFLPLRWIINFQKAGTFFFVLALMHYYNNFSWAAHVYLALHGTYGFCWLIKV